MDAIVITQEAIHSIKPRKLKVLLLKLDLEKSFDKVYWDFLRLVLIQIGFPLSVVKWILSCVTSAHFAILVSGTPSSFFKSGRGIRQGYPLSPFLFLLIIEGLSRLILDAKAKGTIKGIKHCKDISTTHLLFANNVLLFGMDSVDEWRCYNDIINVFSKASRIYVSNIKSNFFHNKLEMTSLDIITSILPYKTCYLDSGFHYLSYFLKPNGYRV